jgi:tetratricopeptide (TPR) repeat protein
MTLLSTLTLLAALATLQEGDESFALYERAEKARKENSPEALTLFRRALGVRRDHIATHIGYQKLLQSRGKEPELVEEYSAMLEDHPEPWCYFALGRLLHDPAREEELYRKGLAKAPRHADLHAALAGALKRGRRFEESENEYLLAIELTPRDRDLHVSYMYLVQEIGREKTLPDLYRRRVEAAPADALWSSLYGTSLGIARDLPAAVGPLERAARIEPTNAGYQRDAAVVHMKMNRLDRAAPFLAAALEADPHDAAALAMQGVVRSVFPKDRGGIDLLREVLRLEPADPERFKMLMWHHVAHRENDEARRCLSEILRLDRNNHEAMYQLAALDMQRGDVEESLERIQTAVDLNDRQAEYFVLLAAIHRRLGQTTEARAATEKASGLERVSDFTLVAKSEGVEIIGRTKIRAAHARFQARSFVIAGKFELAKAKYRKSIELDPKALATYSDLSRVHRRLGEVDEAITLLRHVEKALADDVQNKEALPYLSWRIGDCLYDLGKRSEALAQYDSAVASPSLTPDRRKKLEKRLETLRSATANSKRFRLAGVHIARPTRENYCMPQSLFAVMRHWKLPADIDALGSKLVESSQGPTVLRTLEHVSKMAEVDVACFLAKEKHLKGLLERGYPLILLSYVLDDGDYSGHANVIVGYDDAQKSFLLEDSNWFNGSDRVAYSRVEHHRILLVAPPREVAELRAELRNQKYCALLNEAEHIIWTTGNVARATSVLDEAIALHADDYLAILLLGIAKEVGGDIKSAAGFYKLCAEAAKAHGDARPLSRLANLHVQNGKIDEAEELLLQAGTCAPGYVNARVKLVELYLHKKKDLDLALLHIDKLIALRPLSGFAHFKKAQALLALKNHGGALEHLEIAAAHNGPPTTFWLLALLQDERGDTARAIESLEELRKIAENEPAVQKIDAALDQLRKELAEKAKPDTTSTESENPDS